MIKLKSLFRRGQGGPSGSSKHGNNNRNKSQSTSSLNTSSESTTEQQQQLNNKHQKLEQQLQQQQQSTFYSQHSSERGVDVGDDELLNNHLQPQQQQHRNNGGATKNTRSATPDSTQSGSNTLPHKRSKTSSSSSSSAANTPKKAPKQPKLVPQPPQQQQQQQPDSSSQVLHGNVMTTLAVAPGTQNAATTPTGVGGPQSALSSGGGGGGGGNNNYNGSAAAAVAQDLYKFNQFIQNEQQQQLLEATTSKMQQLQEQLDIMEHDKRMLELRVGELLPYQGEVGKLKNELIKMQGLHEKNQMEISNLKYENESLRNRLHDVVNSPLSDSEKHQIIQDSQRLHSSAPASIALPTTIVTAPESESPLPGERSAPPTTPSCLTPDWDKQSSSSEISVACLQDKIIQMEETHYSTSEELQATLQELADLQNQLSDAHVENERLAEEKDVLFQSLCRQTEKLNDARTQITHLQELLVEDAKRQQEEVGASERENKLLDLIKTSQEEREAILVKQEEMNGELSELRQTLETSAQEAQCCHERIALLESTLDAASAERKQLDAQHSQARDELSQQQLEINRLSTLLENARSKIEELEADLARGEKTDLTDVLDAARKEKDALEERVAEIQDQHSRSQAECRRLREQLSAMTEECKVAKNNAKCAVSHLEYRLEQLKQEKDKLHAEYQQLAEQSAELQVQCKCHLEDKTQLQTLLSETQTHLCEAERKLKEGEERLEKEIALRKQEAEEWQQFQSDLLMTVRVANDFKTEALSAREQSMIDNKTLKEKIRLLEQQIDKLTKQQSQQNDTPQAAPLGGSTAPTEVVTRRHHPLSSFGTTSGSAAVSSTTTAAPTSAGSLLLSRQDSRLSVKTLIESIENNSTKGDTDVEASSSVGSSAASTPSASTNSTPEITPNTPAPLAVAVAAAQPQQSATLNGSVSTTSTTTAVAPTNTTNGPTSGKGPLREQQQQQQTPSLVLNNYSSLNNLSKTILTGDRKDPLNMLAKNGGSKRNALLKWCQNKTVGYRNIDITNFSSSWNDGLAFCAILHSYLPDRIPYDTLTPANKRRNFSLAFAAAESVGIPTTLNINDMCAIERPEWKDVMTYITDIYKHFET